MAPLAEVKDKIFRNYVIGWFWIQQNLLGNILNIVWHVSIDRHGSVSKKKEPQNPVSPSRNLTKMLKLFPNFMTDPKSFVQQFLRNVWTKSETRWEVYKEHFWSQHSGFCPANFSPKNLWKSICDAAMPSPLRCHSLLFLAGLRFDPLPLVDPLAVSTVGRDGMPI